MGIDVQAGVEKGNTEHSECILCGECVQKYTIPTIYMIQCRKNRKISEAVKKRRFYGMHCM